MTGKNGYVVTESTFAAVLLGRLLKPSLLEEVGLLSSSFRSSAIAGARTLLADRLRPVALLLDSGTVIPRHVGYQEDVVDDMLKMARPDIPSAIIFSRPELEVVFFQDPAGLSRLLHVSITEDELRIAPYVPAKVLDELFARSPFVKDRDALVAALDQKAVRAMRRHTIIRDLESFLETSMPRVRSAAA